MFICRLQHKSVTRLNPAPFKQFSLLPFRTVDTLVKLSFRSVTGPVCTCHSKHASGIWISVGWLKKRVNFLQMKI